MAASCSLGQRYPDPTEPSASLRLKWGSYWRGRILVIGAMEKLSKYHAISAHLAMSKKPELRMSFREIEEVLGFSLPLSAYKYPAWWANESISGRRSTAWLSVGWQTEQLDLAGRKVTFRRGDVPSSVGGTSRAGRKRQSKGSRATQPDDGEQRLAPHGKPIRVCVGAQWRTLGPVTLASDGGLRFPTAPEEPGLYRFRLSGEESGKHYVGETTNLRRRLQHYRTPGPSQATNRRIRSLFIEHLALGEQIHVDVLIDDFELVIGDVKTVAALKSKTLRRLLENALLVAEEDSGTASLNL